MMIKKFNLPIQILWIETFIGEKNALKSNNRWNKIGTLLFFNKKTKKQNLDFYNYSHTDV